MIQMHMLIRSAIVAALLTLLVSIDVWIRKNFLDVRKWLLFIGAELGFGLGLSYMFSPHDSLPVGLSPLPEWGLRFYAALWLISAGLCAYLAVSKRRFMPAIAFVGAPPFIWGMTYAWSFICGYDQGLRGLIVYYFIAAIVFSVAYWEPVGGWRRSV